jgi:bacteriocin-like protein
MNSATTLEVNGGDKQTEDARTPKKDPRLFVKQELSDHQLDQVTGGMTTQHNIFLDWRYDA